MTEEMMKLLSEDLKELTNMNLIVSYANINQQIGDYENISFETRKELKLEKALFEKEILRRLEK